jgi:HEAT repeat protein
MAQSMALDEENIRALPLQERIRTLESIFKNSDDESKRWDAVWLLGEVAEELADNNPLLENVSDLCAYVLRYDDNSVVRHEVCYQIAGRNMRDKIPDLVWSALNDPSDLVRHEATECLGIIHADEEIETIKKAAKDPSKNVRDTADFVLKRMKRTTGKKFNPTTTSF